MNEEIEALKDKIFSETSKLSNLVEYGDYESANSTAQQIQLLTKQLMLCKKQYEQEKIHRP
jgi:hypothetical protein